MHLITKKFAFGPTEVPKLEYQRKTGSQNISTQQDFEDMLRNSPESSTPVLAPAGTQAQEDQPTSPFRTLYISIVDKRPPTPPM